MTEGKTPFLPWGATQDPDQAFLEGPTPLITCPHIHTQAHTLRVQGTGAPPLNPLPTASASPRSGLPPALRAKGQVPLVIQNQMVTRKVVTPTWSVSPWHFLV